jgi:hypothetical protein
MPIAWFVTPPQELAAWLYEHAATLEALCGVQAGVSQQAEALRAATQPSTSSDYWNCVSRLVAVGRVHDALSLLDVHTAMQQAARSSAALPEPARQEVGLPASSRRNIAWRSAAQHV